MRTPAALLLGLLGFLVAAALLWWAGWATDGSTTSHDLVDATPTRPGQAGEVHRHEREARPRSVRRVRGGRAAAAFRVRGRCVDAVARTPVAGCAVTLRILAQGRAEDPPPRLTSTGADGRFEIGIEPQPSWWVQLELRHDSYVGLDVDHGHVRAGEVADFGEVAMHPGSRVAGRVADGDGRPRGGALLALSRDDPDREGRLGFETLHEFTTRGDGSFEVGDRVAAGVWEVESRSMGVEILDPRTVEIVDGRWLTRVDIRVRAHARTRAVAGRLRNEDGDGLARVLMVLSDAKDGTAVGITGADGTFVIDPPEPAADGPLRISLVVPKGYEPLADPPRIEWGTKGVDLVLRRSLGIDVEVVAAGAPAPGFGVRCYTDPRGRDVSPRECDVRESGEHGDGRLALDGVRRGRHVLLVVPGIALVPSPPVEFELGDGPRPKIRVELFRPVERELVVVRPDGAPVVSTRVELIRPLFVDRVEVDTVSLPARDRWPAGAGAMVLQEGRTDAHGRIVLRGPSRESVVLRLLGPGHPPQVTSGVRLDRGTGPLRIVVRNGATILGRLRPAGLIGARKPSPSFRALLQRKHGPGAARRMAGLRPHVRLVGPGRHFFPPEPSDGGSLTDGGRFEITGIPPGTWTLVFVWYRPESFENVADAAEVVEPIETLPDLHEGERRELTVDVSGLVPGRLEARLLVDGRPFASGPVRLHGRRADGQELAAPAEARTDSDGRFAVDLTPGTWTVAAMLAKEPWPAWIRCREARRVAAGRTARAVLHLTRARVVVRVLTRAGEPAADRLWHAEIPGDDLFRDGKTDREGRLVLEPAPPGPITIVVWDASVRTDREQMELYRHDRDAYDRAQTRLGPVRVPVGQKTAAFELRLPGRKK